MPSPWSLAWTPLWLRRYRKNPNSAEQGLGDCSVPVPRECQAVKEPHGTDSVFKHCLREHLLPPRRTCTEVSAHFAQARGYPAPFQRTHSSLLVCTRCFPADSCSLCAAGDTEMCGTARAVTAPAVLALSPGTVCDLHPTPSPHLHLLFLTAPPTLLTAQQMALVKGKPLCPVRAGKEYFSTGYCRKFSIPSYCLYIVPFPWVMFSPLGPALPPALWAAAFPHSSHVYLSELLNPDISHFLLTVKSVLCALWPRCLSLGDKQFPNNLKELAMERIVIIQIYSKFTVKIK